MDLNCTTLDSFSSVSVNGRNYFAHPIFRFHCLMDSFYKRKMRFSWTVLDLFFVFPASLLTRSDHKKFHSGLKTIPEGQNKFLILTANSLSPSALAYLYRKELSILLACTKTNFYSIREHKIFRCQPQKSFVKKVN